jgi:hypothetical protein
MWLVDPKIMCRKHLLGEHVELHMFVGTIKKGTSIKGYVDNHLVDTSLIKQRHEELVKEMERRGYKHKTPLEYVDSFNVGKIDPEVSKAILLSRCIECKQNG